MNWKHLAGPGAAMAAVVALASPASAHVTTDPASAPKGGEITVRFRVPNETTTATVTKIDVAFPTDHPLLGVLVAPVPGWTPTVTEVRLDPPAQTDGGPVAQAVSKIAWTASGGGTPVGQFQEFPLLVQRLPTDVDRVVFKVVQTYSDGAVVRWIDPVVAGQATPEHPTPILTLTAGDDTATVAPVTTPDLAQVAKKGSVSSARTLAIVGIALGAASLGLVLLTRGRRRSDAPTP
jgi:uncharacterized protein YcnI